MIVQCAVRWWDLKDLGWDRLRCPVIASCGDAMPLCNLEAVFKNLPLLTRLYVEGRDYIDAYGHGPDLHKLHFQKLCADNHFKPLPPAEKLYDWCFLGQAYQLYDQRLKHYRRELIPQLLDLEPNGYVSGPHWQEVLGDRCRGDWIDQRHLNVIYHMSRAVVSIDAHDGPGYTSTRTIEAMHAGHCALLYDHAGMGYLRQWVRDGEHAMFFRTPHEFRDKLELVRREPEMAAKIGAAARTLVLERGWTASAWMRECLALAG